MKETNASVMRKYRDQILELVSAAPMDGVARGYLSRSSGIHAAVTLRTDGVEVRWGGPWEDGGSFLMLSPLGAVEG